MANRTRRDLSVDEIVQHALEILSTEGEAAVTMRRLAAECGVTAMALYHHVPDKEAVLELAVDRAISVALDAERHDDWRISMLNFGTAFRSAMVDNRGAGAVLLRRPILGPNMALVTERFFEILAEGGIDGHAAAEATDSIVLLTFGSIANDLTRPPEIREQLRNHLPDGSTPRMIADMDTYAGRDPEARYRVALQWLLEGIAQPKSR